MSPVNIGSFISSFPLLIPLVPFSCFVSLASSRLNQSGKGWHSCYIPDFWDKASSISSSVMFVVGFKKYIHSVKEVLFYSLFC